MPYVSVAGDTPSAAAETPVPVALTDPLPPSLSMLIVALLAPAGAAGVNVTLSVALLPGAMGETVDGETENSALADVIPVTLRVPVPELEMVTVFAVEVLPIV